MSNEFVFRVIRLELPKNSLCVVGLAIVLFIATLGLIAPLIAKDPYETNMAERLKPPSLEHHLGRINWVETCFRELFTVREHL